MERTTIFWTTIFFSHQMNLTTKVGVRDNRLLINLKNNEPKLK